MADQASVVAAQASVVAVQKIEADRTAEAASAPDLEAEAALASEAETVVADLPFGVAPELVAVLALDLCRHPCQACPGASLVFLLAVFLDVLLAAFLACHLAAFLVRSLLHRLACLLVAFLARRLACLLAAFLVCSLLRHPCRLSRGIERPNS